MKQNHRYRWLILSLLVLLVACAGPGKPSIKLGVTPTSLDDGEEVTLKAEASGGQGSLKVEFYKAGQKLGEDATAPFELKHTLTSDQDTTLSFTAKAIAADGQSSTSDAVSVRVKVDKEAPSIVLSTSSPKLEAAGAVTLSAEASDNKGVVKVEFFKGTDKFGQDTTPADGFNLRVNLSAEDNGSLKYIAKAYDKKGNVGTSAEVSLTVDIDLAAPAISLSADKTSLKSPGTITLIADASDKSGVSKVEFYKGLEKITEDLEAPYIHPLSFGPADNGTHSYSARAIDAKSNTATSNTLTLSIDIDVINPTIGLSADKTTVNSPGPVLLKANATDNKGIAKVEFYQDSQKIAEDLESPFAHELNFGVEHNGSHRYSAKAIDPSGNTAQSETLTIRVDIDATAPTVSLSADKAGLDSVGSILLSAQASDNKGVSKIEFYKNGNKVGEDTSAEDGFALTLHYSQSQLGTDLLSAVAYDSENNHGTSNTVEVAIDIDITPPTANLSANSNQFTQPGPLVLTLNHSDNREVEMVEFYLVSPVRMLLKQVMLPKGPQTFETDIDPSLNADHRYMARAYDFRGNVAESAEVEVEVAIKPSITRFAAATGSSLEVADSGGTVELEWDFEHVRSYSLEVSPGDATATLETDNSGRVVVPPNLSQSQKIYTVTLRATAYDSGIPNDGSDIPDEVKTLSIKVAPDTTPPALNLSRSPTGDIHSEGSITLSATASDAAGVDYVEFYQGTTLLFSDGDASDGYTHNLSYSEADNNTYSYTAKAFDTNGNSRESNALEVKVDIDTTRPVVALSSNTYSLSTPAFLTLSADASDANGIARVEFFAAGQSNPIGSDTEGSDGYTHIIAFGAANNGNHRYTAKAYDNRGNVKESESLVVAVAIPAQLNTFSSNLNGLGDRGGTLSLNWAAQYHKDFSLTLDKTEGVSGLPSPNTSLTSATIALPANNSQSPVVYTFTLTANAYGLAPSDSKSLQVRVAPDTTPPTVSLATSNNQILVSSTIALTATANDTSGIEKVEFYKVQGGSNTLLSTDTSSPYEHPVSYTAADNGTHNYFARAHDRSGNTSDSAASMVKVNIFDFSSYPAPNPTGLAFDSLGNLWFTQHNNNKISKISASDLASCTPSNCNHSDYPVSGNPHAIRFDNSGNLWFTQVTGSRLSKISASNLAACTQTSCNYTDIISAFNSMGIYFDATGNLWFSQYGSGRIIKIAASDLAACTPVSCPQTIYLLEQGLSGLVFDSLGNLWVGNRLRDKISKITADNLAACANNYCSYTSYPVSSTPTDLRFDSHGNLWFNQFNSSWLGKISASDLASCTPTHCPRAEFALSGNPVGLVFDQLGNLWFAQYNGNKISKHVP